MVDYIAAESAGRLQGECWRYQKDCNRSLFKLNKYSREAQKLGKKWAALEQIVSPKMLSSNEVM